MGIILITQVKMSSRERKRVRPRVQIRPCKKFAIFALDHTVAHAECDRGVEDFVQEDDEDEHEEGDDKVDDWCNDGNIKEGLKKG